MTRTVQKRDRLLRNLPITAEMLRGSLVSRTVIRHRQSCTKCASGQGHPLSLLTVTYPGGNTRQFSLHVEQVPVVRRWLSNYRQLKDAIEEICELNHQLLRTKPDSSPPRSNRRD